MIKIGDIDLSGEASSVGGYWRVIKLDREDGEEYKDDEFFTTLEEAEANCKACQLQWREDADDIREYSSMEYQVRFVTLADVAEEKRQKLEKWHSFVREAYLDPIVPAKFKSCCQRLVADMLQRIERPSKEDLSEMRHDGKALFSPWQAYGGCAKLWAYMQLEPGSTKVSYWGMLTQRSLAGSIRHQIAVFESVADFKVWLVDTNHAAEVLEKSMLDMLHETVNSDKLPE